MNSATTFREPFLRITTFLRVHFAIRRVYLDGRVGRNGGRAIGRIAGFAGFATTDGLTRGRVQQLLGGGRGRRMTSSLTQGFRRGQFESRTNTVRPAMLVESTTIMAKSNVDILASQCDSSATDETEDREGPKSDLLRRDRADEAGGILAVRS